MRKPTNFQRLLREKTLHRYLVAVENVDLATIEAIWQRATRDALLEHMLVEAHETYLDQEPDVLQEEINMDFKEGIHKSMSGDELAADEPEPAPVPQPQHRQSARWLQVLAAVLLIACLSGSVLLYTRLHHNAPPTSSTQATYKWCVTSGPAADHPPFIPALNSIAAIAPDNIWAVGNESSQGSVYTVPSLPLIEHWDGHGWNIVPGADTTALYQNLASSLTGVPSSEITEGTALSNISAVSANDIWAVGSISANGPSSSVFHTLIEHWDGQQWQLVASPDVDSASGALLLLSLAAVAANDVWVVGAINPPTSSSSSATPQAVVERWNGSNWSFVPLPASSKSGDLTSIAATAPDNVWVFGQTEGDRGSIPLALHWDGQSWHVTAFPQMSPTFFNLNAAPTSSANDLWVTGQAKQTDGTNQPFVMHWNGQQWSTLAGLKDVQAIQSTNLQQETDSALNAIVVNNPHDVWVAGVTAAGNSLIEHWDGHSWSIVSQQLPLQGDVHGLAISGGKVWAVGDGYDRSQQISTGALIATSC